jgi:hypothetical protein
MAEAMAKLVDDRDLYARTAAAARAWSATFSFDRAAAIARDVIAESVAAARRAPTVAAAPGP